MSEWLIAVILGLVEGLTEFIPVSSTGHLLLANSLLGVEGDQFWETFIVLIQLGAILAVIAVYFARLWRVLVTLPTDPNSRRFAISVLLAFLPSAVLGVLFHDFIKDVLFSPWVVCVSLIVGGFALLALERWAPAARQDDAFSFGWKTALAIGLWQCVSMIPGVSRSGATIVGGLLQGVSKRAAAEFSFFLAIPTMAGAFVLDFWESRQFITPDGLGVIAVGFVVSFVSGLLVVKTLVNFVARHGFAPFSWWRIAAGAAGLAWLSLR